jgi:uncharacterized membrane-anchored protein
VLNVQPMSSGRFPNLGPQLLVEAGVLVVDSIGDGGLATLADGRAARVDDGTVYDGEQRLTSGRVVGLDTVEAEMGQARAGMVAQLETLTHTSAELLRREQGVLLDGVGLPSLTTRLEGRTVLVVADGPETAGQLRAMRRFLREQPPVVVATAAAIPTVRTAGLRADVVVVGPGDDLPEAKALRAARDVVLCGATSLHDEGLARLNTAAHRVITSLGPRDMALLIGHAGAPRLLVTAGMSADLADLLDRDRGGAAGAYLTRLAIGPQVVDASAVPALYSGKVRVHHVLLSLLVCVLAVAAAIATTDVGHDWLRHLIDWVEGIR